MMITLEQAKQHLNLEKDYTLDDEYIQGLVGVAEQAVEVAVNEKLDKLAENNGGTLPEPIRQAMLLMIGNFYQNREPVAPMKVTELPFSYQYLIDLYHNYIN